MENNNYHYSSDLKSHMKTTQKNQDDAILLTPSTSRSDSLGSVPDKSICAENRYYSRLK